MIAEICRRPSPQQASKPDCASVLRLPVKPGVSEAMDHLPASLVQGPLQGLGYGVRILNQNGHSAGMSSTAMTASGLVPEEVKALQVEAAAQGAVLQWRPDGSDAVVELMREIAVQSQRAGKPRGAVRVHTADLKEIRLRIAPGADRADGTLDPTAKMGEQYIYRAQRVRGVTVDGKTVEVRSALSPSVTIAMRDVFPPQPPSGLEAVSDGRRVDLSWRPNGEADLAGYFVYRLEAGIAGPPTSMNQQPVTEPAFHDASVISGHAYRYSVVAVDTTGNRSAPGEMVAETVRTP